MRNASDTFFRPCMVFHENRENDLDSMQRLRVDGYITYSHLDVYCIRKFLLGILSWAWLEAFSPYVTRINLNKTKRRLGSGS